jgi:hypothetical protein
MGSSVSKNKTLKTALALSMEPTLQATSAYLTNKESKDKAEQTAADAEAEAAAAKAETAATAAAAAETEAQQEAVRKKLASLGRLQAGYTFSDSTASTGTTKVFS